MNTPITPSSQPHGYYSQINQDNQQLPENLKDHLNTIKDGLHQIKIHSQQAAEHSEYINKAHGKNASEHSQHKIKNLVEAFERLDQDHAHFFTELNKDSNRGFEKHIKDKFESFQNEFTDELNEIKDSHETGLRDVLYDHDKLTHFLEDLTKTRQGQDSLQHISKLAETFAKEISDAFQL